MLLMFCTWCFLVHNFIPEASDYGGDINFETKHDTNTCGQPFSKNWALQLGKQQLEEKLNIQTRWQFLVLTPPPPSTKMLY